MIRQLLRPFAILTAPLSRRAVVGALGRIGILASAAPAVSAAGTRDDAEVRSVANLIRELVPHAVDEAVYLDAARAIRAALGVTAEQADDCLRRLREHGSGGLPASDPLIGRVRTAAVEALYRDPRVWKLIGYGGNALAKGGYVATFNDIDWLPGARK
jgi:hypothetical protein